MDQRTRKLMTMHKTLHPRDDVDRLYVSRRKGRRGLANIEDSVDTSLQRLEGYIEKCAGRLTATGNNTDDKIGLVSLFNDISTFVGYLIPKPFS